MTIALYRLLLFLGATLDYNFVQSPGIKIKPLIHDPFADREGTSSCLFASRLSCIHGSYGIGPAVSSLGLDFMIQGNHPTTPQGHLHL
ncbi:MAG: hypothetical protein HC934_14350 [Acaryochloridaceae cyanobacterium SU_2_1]|nr:hypothetical protein [Acaryochloridaceae cyanobacterium SU_2_1]